VKERLNREIKEKEAETASFPLDETNVRRVAFEKHTRLEQKGSIQTKEFKERTTEAVETCLLVCLYALRLCSASKLLMRGVGLHLILTGT
jgi:hypothetical protein